MYVCKLDEDAYALMVPIILHTDLCIYKCWTSMAGCDVRGKHPSQSSSRKRKSLYAKKSMRNRPIQLPECIV